MNLIKYAFLFVVLLVFSLSCKKGFDQETPNGFPYQIHHKGTGDKVSYGHYIYTWFSISTGDSTLFETPELEGKPVFLRDLSKYSAKIADPVLDILPLLSVGDSATVVVEVDELMRLSDDLKDIEQLYYHVVVKSIETLEERKKEEEEGRGRRKKKQKKELQRRAEEMQEHPEGGMAYQNLRIAIASHSTNPDLKRTASGLEYIILNQGERPTCQSGEQINVHYIGMQEEGLVFDETYSSDKTFRFLLNKGRVIKAWDEGIQLLGVRGEIFLKVPPALGYGATGYEPLIKPNAILYFYVKVVSKE